MTFRELEARLIEAVRRKARRGETSERRLARLTGFTQPHLHNVLSGRRRLRADLADRLLEAADIRLEDLAGGQREGGEAVEIPVWPGAVGPGEPFPVPGRTASWWFPISFARRFCDPVLVRVAPDEDAMHPLIAPGDLVLLDRAETARRRPEPDAVWAIALEGRGALRRCRLAGEALVLLADNPRAACPLPGQVSVRRRDPADIVRGRVVWLGRELDLL